MSIRFVYSPRFVGVALNATKQTLSMAKHAATRRLNAIVTATRAQKSLAERAASLGGQSYNGLTPSFYISTTGTGTAAGGGSLGDPWSISMLNNATARARYAGTVVGIMDGTYGLYSIMGLPSSDGYDTNRLLVDGGTVGDPTIIVSQTPRGAIIDGQREAIWAANSVDWQFGLIGPLGDYVTLDGLHLTGANYRTVTNYSVGGSNFTVRNCLFDDQSFITYPTPAGANSCMLFTSGHDRTLVQNCRFEGGGAPSDSYRHSHALFYDSADIVFENCTFIAGTASQDLLHFKQGNVDDITIRYCYLDISAITQTTSGSENLKFDAGGNSASVCAVHNNVLVSGGPRGRPHVFGESAGFSGTFSFYNNTMVGNYNGTSSSGLANMYAGTFVAFNFYNNILYRTVAAGSGRDLDLPAISELGTFNYNLYAGSPTFVVRYNADSATATGLAAWRTASSDEANSATANDPLFTTTGVEAEYYELQGGSPAKTLGAGSTEIGAWGGGASSIGSSF